MICESSLIPRPLLNFITQLWRKSGEGLVSNHYYITDQRWWTQFRKDGNVPTQYETGTASDQVCLDVMQTATDFANTKSITNDL